MPLRVKNIYRSMLLDDLCKKNQLTANGTLPPVFPSVFYYGERKWTSSLELCELIDSMLVKSIRISLIFVTRCWRREPLSENVEGKIS